MADHLRAEVYRLFDVDPNDALVVAWDAVEEASLLRSQLARHRLSAHGTVLARHLSEGLPDGWSFEWRNCD